ncbi:MAG: hypothetical protein KKC51_06980 [Verrucomicrobia bacterium]|nr:hypothetical protein [Verrucomicrobiota bacterium]
MKVVKVALCALLIGSLPTWAGYRNISKEYTRSSSESTVSPRWQAQIIRAHGQRLTPVNRAGRMDPLDVEALEVVDVVLTRVGLPEGASVYAYVVNGGRINGRISETLVAGKEGRISFAFQAGRYFGDYPVVLRHNGREETLMFWVKQAKLAPAEEQKP